MLHLSRYSFKFVNRKIKIMNKDKQKLMIEQLDRRFMKLCSCLQELEVPEKGWINTLRKTLNISLKQLGVKLRVSSQNINQLEQREIDGSVTIKRLKEVAEALNMNFVYSFIPKDGSLETYIEKRAYEIAKELTMRTSHTMKLEDQGNSNERLNKAIKDRTEKIKNELPKYLWD